MARSPQNEALDQLDRFGEQVAAAPGHMSALPDDAALFERFRASGSITTTRASTGDSSNASSGSTGAVLRHWQHPRLPCAALLVDPTSWRPRSADAGDLPPHRHAPGPADARVDYHSGYAVGSVELVEQRGLRYTSAIEATASGRRSGCPVELEMDRALGAPFPSSRRAH